MLDLKAEKLTQDSTRRADVYGVAQGDAGRLALASAIDQLRGAGIPADMSYGGKSNKPGMKAADKAGAVGALALGDSAGEDGTATGKNLVDGSQTQVQRAEIVNRAA